jgi:putative tryptophan/tyrosine transport system substrate-binding protein
LISYGDDPNDQYRRAAIHVDRILKGRSPDLPVQQSTKLELVINLKSLAVPRSILLGAIPCTHRLALHCRSDEVIG